MQHPYFVGHLRSPLWPFWAIGRGQLPGWCLGFSTNLQVDTLSPVSQAIQSHSEFHQNSRAPCKRFHITREQAHQIVKSCSKCAPHLSVPSKGINPRGLHSLSLWQMDVTYFPSLGWQHYVHVVIDTYFGFVFASPRSGEATHHVIGHCLAAFVVIGKPLHIKTDNGPGYTSLPPSRLFVPPTKFFILQAYPTTPKAKL
jgi:transposase InsO family protein